MTASAFPVCQKKQELIKNYTLDHVHALLAPPEVLVLAGEAVHVLLGRLRLQPGLELVPVQLDGGVHQPRDVGDLDRGENAELKLDLS